MVVVAPLVGAWIETPNSADYLLNFVVAPLVGAWIETDSSSHFRNLNLSHPSWVRGLKHLRFKTICYICSRTPRGCVDWNKDEKWESFTSRSVAPLVGAWIETLSAMSSSIFLSVAPLVGAWIETLIIQVCWEELLSHPSWVRGLKQRSSARKSFITVAPLVGAWIETIPLENTVRNPSSHPSWVRGLKLGLSSSRTDYK